MKCNESWYEKDWILALFAGIVGPLFVFTSCILGWIVWTLRLLKELIWLEYKCFLLLISEISFEELTDFIHKRTREL